MTERQKFSIAIALLVIVAAVFWALVLSGRSDAVVAMAEGAFGTAVLVLFFWAAR